MVGPDFLGIVVESVRFEVFEKMNRPKTGVQNDGLPARKFGDRLEGFLQRGGWFEKSKIESLSSGFLSFHAFTIAEMRERFLDLGQFGHQISEFIPNPQCLYPTPLRRDPIPGAS